MARGACDAAGSELGLSTTGIAGPTGGSVQKPVGLVYVGLCLRGEGRVVRLELRGDRRRIKDRSARHALNLARLALRRGLASLPEAYTM
jgi:nicotinamide-nucleotide amidase